MNSEPSDKQKPLGVSHQDANDLNAAESPRPADVPVFNCLVYVSAEPAGGVKARVANLPGLQFTADSEREVLAKVVPAFKKRVGELLQSEAAIPWIDPPSPAKPEERQRFIPVHL